MIDTKSKSNTQGFTIIELLIDTFHPLAVHDTLQVLTI